MAFTDVINTTGAMFQTYPEMDVYIGPANGDPPPAVSPTVLTDAHCVRVVQSASGSRLDFAECQYGLTDHLKNRSQPALFSRMIEVKLPDVAETRIHLGDMTQEAASITKDDETLTFRSVVHPYHFGDPVTGYDVHNPSGGLTPRIDDDIVFNPVIDDKVIPNRSSVIRTNPVGAIGNLWTHPELADTSVGIAFQGQYRSSWSLYFAVIAMCELLNGSETFIANPDLAGYGVIAVGAPPLRNVRIPMGTRLHQALDMLLIPLGYNWYLDYSQTKPQITFFQIGDGTAKELKFQLPPAVLNLDTSNINQLATEHDIGNTINVVTVFGEFEEAECTFPLFPAWKAADDSISPSDLNKTDGAQYVGHESAWRLFIANEAGDLDPAVSRLGQLPVVPDLRTVFIRWIPHRRQIGEPITYLLEAQDDKPQRRPHVVEYSTDGGDTWAISPPGWTIKVCPDQIGILFDGDDIPDELYNAGETARLRITGTVFGDGRITYKALKQAWAASGRTVEQVISRPDKFQKRWRHEYGDYASELTGAVDEVDDSANIQDFAEQLRDQNQYAEVDCEFRLPGWHIEYEIGDLISKVAGRELNLDAAPATAPANRYPQIVERRFEMTKEGGPSTVLIVDRGVTELPK